jgi:hypothetical protein
MNENMKRKSQMQWVPIEKMRSRDGVTQRKIRPDWARKIAGDFDADKFGVPVVNRSGEWFWLLDGQHRVEAFKIAFPDWQDQKLECLVYHNLTEKEEAEIFLGQNDVKSVNAFDKFRIAVTAEREAETNIEAILRLKKIKLSDRGKNHSPGSLSCVATLRRVYDRGHACLATTLTIVYESFGDSGLDSDVIDGVGQLVSRYDGLLKPGAAVQALLGLKGGVNTLRARAERLRQQTGVARAQCIAAASVEIINRGKGGKKLPSWWKFTENQS